MPYTEEQIKSFERDQIAGKTLARFLHRWLGSGYDDTITVHLNAIRYITALLNQRQERLSRYEDGFLRDVELYDCGRRMAIRWEDRNGNQRFLRVKLPVQLKDGRDRNDHYSADTNGCRRPGCDVGHTART